MRSSFDRRVVSDAVLTLVRACQARVPCHLAGGAALSGAYLAHRLSNALALFCHDAAEHRQLVDELATIGNSVGAVVLAWLLASFPIEPLPKMLVALGTDELRAYRDALAERMRTVSVP